jgi:choline monooxygenase
LQEIRYAIDPESYTSDSYYARERADHLAKSWIFLAHEDRLRRPGDTVADLVMGTSVIARRGRDSRLRAFHNICRHRAGPLLWDGEESRGPLRCRYHGWIYNDDGCLTSAPGFYGGSTKTPPAGDYRLFPVRIESWRGLVFINFDTEAPPLSGSLGGLPSLLDGFDLERLQPRHRQRFVFKCNWKLYIENWLESYHIPWLHLGLSKDVKVADYRVGVDDGVVVHTAPQAGGGSVYEGLWVWTPLTTGWNLYPGGLSVERILPVNADATFVDYLFLFDSLASEDTVSATLAMCERVTNEDGRACEAVHVNLQQGLFRSGPLSPVHEIGIAYLHSLLATPPEPCLRRVRHDAEPLQLHR